MLLWEENPVTYAGREILCMLHSKLENYSKRPKREKLEIYLTC